MPIFATCGENENIPRQEEIQFSFHSLPVTRLPLLSPINNHRLCFPFQCNPCSSHYSPTCLGTYLECGSRSGEPIAIGPGVDGMLEEEAVAAASGCKKLRLWSIRSWCWVRHLVSNSGSASIRSWNETVWLIKFPTIQPEISPTIDSSVFHKWINQTGDHYVTPIPPPPLLPAPSHVSQLLTSEIVLICFLVVEKWCENWKPPINKWGICHCQSPALKLWPELRRRQRPQQQQQRPEWEQQSSWFIATLISLAGSLFTTTRREPPATCPAYEARCSAMEVEVPVAGRSLIWISSSGSTAKREVKWSCGQNCTCKVCNLSSRFERRSSTASCLVDISDTISYTVFCVCGGRMRGWLDGKIKRERKRNFR